MIIHPDNLAPGVASRRTVDTRLTVETPEGVDFRFELAGPGLRGYALAIDMGLILVVVLAFFLVLSSFQLVSGGLFGGLSLGLILVVLFLVKWFYSALFEGFCNGRTPGKMVMRLRVVRSNGTPIGFPEAFGRGLMHAADLMPLPCFYTVGLVVMTLNGRLQRLGDLFFDTMVIDESIPHVQPGPLFELPVPPIPRAACQRSWSIPPRTLATIERLFERHRRLSRWRREELAVRLANPVSRILGYAPELDPGPETWSASRPSGQFPEMPDPQTTPATLFLIRVHHTFHLPLDNPAPAVADGVVVRAEPHGAGDTQTAGTIASGVSGEADS